MKATLCKSYEEFNEAGLGAIWFDGAGNMLYKCPRECANEWRKENFGPVCMMRLPIDASSGERPWTMTGTQECPTISPSIYNCKNTEGGCEWHGWLQNGEWRNA